jgi:LysR family transcriptional activator of nhaA
MRERDLNYQHLRYFYTVAHEGSVQRAARLLHLSPSTVSGQIKTLEENLGRPVFERVGRGLVLTSFGAQILTHVDHIFATGAEVVRIASGSRRREIRVGVSNVLPKLLVRELLLPAFGDEVTLAVEHGTAEDLFGALVARRVDAILSDGPTPGWVSAETHDHLVAESAIAVFGAPVLRERVGDDLPGGLARVPWIVPPHGTPLRAGLEGWWESRGLKPELAAVVDDSGVVKALADAGVGVFAAPERMQAAILEGYHVDTIGVTEEIRERAYVITREAEPRDASILALCTPLQR